MKIIIFLLQLSLFVSCGRFSLKNPDKAMRLTEKKIIVEDTLNLELFRESLKSHIEVMKTSVVVTDPMSFGPIKISKIDYINCLEKILNVPENNLIEYINQNFDLMEVYGRNDWGEVLSTGYYEPHIIGSTIPTEKYFRPIYKRPDDLPTDYSNGNKYFSRKEIEVDGVLKDKNLELYYLDPVDAFFLQIQGSGVIETIQGKKVRVGYDGQNGHTYEAIGKHLTHVIPLKEMSMQRIKEHLNSLPLNERQEILNINNSFVFFRELEDKAVTTMGADVTSGRTIATDRKFFPKGALAFLKIKEPRFDSIDDSTPSYFIDRPRLVFDQDTGGAIKGGGRVDLYFGAGPYYEKLAGGFKEIGQLYYLIPKDRP